MPRAAYDGAAGSHGGTISATQSQTTTDGLPVLRVGDPYACPIHGAQAVAAGSSRFTVLGQPLARVGDPLTCGAVIVGPPSSNWEDA